MITKISSRELNQDVGKAKKAAQQGPVLITDRGRPAHVLLTYEAFERLSKQTPTLAECLSMQGLSDIEFEPAKLSMSAKPAAFD
ncbi:MAG: type II toxin-antitoxin system Phd/YefM family antitoxin [Sphingomonadales bacterium]